MGTYLLKKGCAYDFKCVNKELIMNYEGSVWTWYGRMVHCITIQEYKTVLRNRVRRDCGL
jgi:hypothetical protein